MPVVLELINQVYDHLNVIIPAELRKKTGIISLGTAILITFLYSKFQKINRPPANLRHLPHVGFYTFLKYVFSNGVIDNYSNEQVIPLLKKGSNGIYLRPNVLSWTILVANPIAVKQMLYKPEHVFPKKPTFGYKGTLIQRFIGGPNIVLLSGHDWRKHRRVANPAFQRSMPIKTFGDLTIKMFNTIEKSGTQTVDVLSLFERWTLDAIGIAGFDFDFNALGDKHNKWVKYYDTIKGGMSHPFFLFFPMFDTKFVNWFKNRKQVHDMLSEFLQNIDNIINEKRRLVKENKNVKKDEEKDLLTLMIESEINGEGGEGGLSNEELQSDLCIFFLAGHDTTANTLSFALYELAMNPELQDKAREEAIRILGNAPEDVVPTLEQTKQFSYINMVMKETMRRHPPAYNTTQRLIEEDINVAGTFIPKGSEWSLDIYNLHHNPNLWKDPYVFNPDRFLPGGEADNQEGIAWIPFSGGQRQCIGMNFSLAEQRVVLSMLLRKYKWSLPSSSPHKEGIKKRGVGFGLIIMNEPIDITFEKLY